MQQAFKACQCDVGSIDFRLNHNISVMPRGPAVRSWRWEPHSCELPSWNASLFCDALGSRKLLFIGDSLMGNLAQTLINYAVPGGCGARVVYTTSHLLNEPFLLGQASGGLRKQPWSTWREDVERHRPDIVVLSAAAHVYGDTRGATTINETQHMEEILADVEEGIAHLSGGGDGESGSDAGPGEQQAALPLRGRRAGRAAARMQAHALDQADQARAMGNPAAPFAPRFVWKDTAALVHPKAMTARAAPVTSAWIAEQRARTRAASTVAENRTREESTLVSNEYQHALFSAWDALAAAAMARVGADYLSMAPLQLRPDAHIPGDSLLALLRPRTV